MMKTNEILSNNFSLKRLIPFIAFCVMITFLSACYQFSSPQPAWIKKNEKEIPQKLRGIYLAKGLNFGSNDTMQIGEKRIQNNKDQKMDYTLSDSVLLKIYHHLYFLNVYSSEEKKWIVMLGREEKNKIILYNLQTSDSTQLKEITNLENNTINPSSREFRKILNSNLFKASDTLIRVH